MKKILLFAALLAVVACRPVKKVTIESSNDCKCLICEACDSLEMSPNKDLWYDSLTTVVYEYLLNNGEPCAYEPTEDLLHNKKFMKAMENDFDGLCTIEDTTGCIAYFYGAYNYYKK